MKLIIKNIKYFLLRRFLKGVSLKLITSTGRTGTQFFEVFFPLLIKNAIVYHEPNPDLFALSIQKIRKNKSNKYIEDYIIAKRGDLLFSKKNILKWIFRKKIIYVESNPFLFPILEEFTTLFKDFQIIYITRDPKTYLISAYNKDPQGDGENNFYGQSDLRKRLTAFDYGEIKNSEWNSFKRIEKIAWYWNKCNKVLYYFYKKNEKKSIHIKFEELFSKNILIKEIAVENLVKFLKSENQYLKNKKLIFSILENKINTSKTLSEIKYFSNIDEITKTNIKHITVEMVKKLNYSI